MAISYAADVSCCVSVLPCCAAADRVGRVTTGPKSRDHLYTLQVEKSGQFHPEVMLFLEQANRGPGKEQGRTADRGKIPDVSPSVVPVYFTSGIQGIEERMLRGQENPFSMVFVVTVHATELDGVIVAYTVTEIHDSFPRDAE